MKLAIASFIIHYSVSDPLHRVLSVELRSRGLRQWFKEIVLSDVTRGDTRGHENGYSGGPDHSGFSRVPHRLQSLRRAERALPARGVEGQMKRPDRLHRQDPIHNPGIVFGDRPNLRLVSRVVQDQSA